MFLPGGNPFRRSVKESLNIIFLIKIKTIVIDPWNNISAILIQQPIIIILKIGHNYSIHNATSHSIHYITLKTLSVHLIDIQINITLDYRVQVFYIDIKL